MYGPASAPGMRTRNVSIFKYLFRKKGKPHNPADIWQPGPRHCLASSLRSCLAVARVGSRPATTAPRLPQATVTWMATMATK